MNLAKIHVVIKTFIFFTALLFAVDCSAVLTPIDQQAIYRRVNSKMIRDPDITAGERVKLACDNIPALFVEAAAKSTIIQPALERVLASPRVTIICTNHQQIAAMQNEFTQALVNASNHQVKIYLSADNHDPRFLVHELIHANWYLLHTSKRCMQKNNLWAFLPFYPVNDARLAEYNRALDAGDKRAREFKKLLAMDKSGGALSLSESYQLMQYQQAATSCLPFTFLVPATTTQYGEICAYFKAHPKVNEFSGYIMTSNYHCPVHFSAQAGSTTLVCYLNDNSESIANLPDDVQKLVQMDESKDKYTKLIEREANTLQVLSAAALDLFYKEVSVLREQEIRKCE